MDLVTVSVEDTMQRPADISSDAKRRLIAKVKKLARKRQLRSELKAKFDSTQIQRTVILDTPQQHVHIHDDVAVVSVSGNREEMDETQPSTTLSSPLPQDTTIISPSSPDAQERDKVEAQEKNEMAPANVPATVPAAVEVSPPAAVPAGKEVAATIQLDNTVMDSPPEQVKGVARRSKNKRTVAEVLPKRQLRSSTKNKSVSAISPEMIQAYANNQCHYVPTDSLGQPKAKQVAPNSPHPTRAQLEDKLRTAEKLGRQPTAYVLDTGQEGALQAMDFVAKQQWDDITNTETVFSDSD